jgi:glycosyltransferase involved in cell wall biosynthesis
VADEAYAATVRAAIDAHRLAEAVPLTGEVADVTRYVRRWDAFVSLSADEGQGLAVLEAMALGVPVVARRVAGIADFLDAGRTGVEVRSASPRAVSGALAALLGSPALQHRLARQARRLVERRYAWSRTVDAFDRLYWS